MASRYSVCGDHERDRAHARALERDRETRHRSVGVALCG